MVLITVGPVIDKKGFINKIELNTTEITKPGKIKRRSFFLYLGASVLGIFTVTKFPFNIIKPASLLQNKLRKKMKVTVNPYAVKREEPAKNG